MVTFIFGGQFHGDDVGAGVGLGHGQGANVLAADELRQVFLFLFFGAVAVNLVHTQVGVGTVGEANGGGSTADFFHGDDVRQVAHVGAAVFFAHGDTQQAHVAHFPPQVHGELVVAVNFLGARCDFGSSKAVDLLAEHIEGFAEAEVEL